MYAQHDHNHACCAHAPNRFVGKTPSNGVHSCLQLCAVQPLHWAAQLSRCKAIKQVGDMTERPQPYGCKAPWPVAGWCNTWAEAPGRSALFLLQCWASIPHSNHMEPLCRPSTLVWFYVCYHSVCTLITRVHSMYLYATARTQLVCCCALIRPSPMLLSAVKAPGPHWKQHTYCLCCKAKVRMK